MSNESEDVTYRATVKPDGSLADLQPFAPRGGECVAVDARGNVYVANGQIFVYRPSRQGDRADRRSGASDRHRLWRRRKPHTVHSRAPRAVRRGDGRRAAAGVAAPVWAAEAVARTAVRNCKLRDRNVEMTPTLQAKGLRHGPVARTFMSAVSAFEPRFLELPTECQLTKTARRLMIEIETRDDSRAAAGFQAPCAIMSIDDFGYPSTLAQRSRRRSSAIVSGMCAGWPQSASPQVEAWVTNPDRSALFQRVPDPIAFRNAGGRRLRRS